MCSFPPRFIWLLLATQCALIGNLFAGGSGLNTLVIVNQSSPQSVELANYFCNQRQVPANNVVRINWTGGNIDWSAADFQTKLLAPILGALASRQLSNQIYYVVLSMDIPFRIINGTTANSTTSALFYGLKNDYGPDYAGITNSYGASESAFEAARPASARGFSFLTCMLTAPTLAQGKRMIDQGVTSDGTFPNQAVYLEKTFDLQRSERSALFDNSILNVKANGYLYEHRTNCSWVWCFTNMAGIQTGLAYFSISPNSFVPGAMADSLTSYGGVVFGPNDQNTLFTFTGAGAAGSYGTVSEPGAGPAKFPNPNNYFYQSRGFTIAECYYQSLYVPYVGLVVAEPLAAPFRSLASSRWLRDPASNIISGVVSCPAVFASASSVRPLQQVDWFVDGKFFATATNIPPLPGNILNLSVNGSPIAFTVPGDATLASVASGLAAAINAPAATNSTGIIAIPHGDRVELRSTRGGKVPFQLIDPQGTNNSPLYYRAVNLPGPIPQQLSLAKRDGRGQFSMHVESFTESPFLVEASSDLINWTPIATNQNGASLDFIDPAAANYPQRFYRTTMTPLDLRPRLSNFVRASGISTMHIDGPANFGYALQASDDLVHWQDVATNQLGGGMDYQDNVSTNSSRGFYRAVVILNPPAPPSLSLLGRSTASGSTLQVSASQAPYVVQVSSDLIQWNSIYTNLAPSALQITASSERGAATNLTTFLSTPRASFMNSEAFGVRQFTINGTLSAGDWLAVSVSKNSGGSATVSVTNALITGTVYDLVQQLVNAINTSPSLVTEDGLVAEDLQLGWFGSGVFHLRARSPGLDGAGMTVRFFNSGSLVQNPDGDNALDSNLSDLQPRSHLYVSSGLTTLSVAGSIDSTVFPDGFHDLSAVAYEGTSVRTQTRLDSLLHIQNSPLFASLTSPDLGTLALATGVFHLQVDVANKTNVKAIHLCSTGGEYLSSTNQLNSLFSIDSSYFGPGRHEFYALVETSDGLKFQTSKKTVTITP